MRGFESVSSWRAPAAAGVVCPNGAGRRPRSADPRLSGQAPGCVDGSPRPAKTSFGHELAAAIRELGRPTLRASLDDFKHPWRQARELGYDRVSGEGYYRNAYDFAAARELLLRPAGPMDQGGWFFARTIR